MGDKKENFSEGCSFTLCRSLDCRADTPAFLPVADENPSCMEDMLRGIYTAQGQGSMCKAGCLVWERKKCGKFAKFVHLKGLKKKSRQIM